MGDHTEAVQVEFDPRRTSYARLLELFWDEHDPDSPPYGRQYMSAIWPAEAEQLRVAKLSMAQRESKLRRRLYTEVEPLGVFTPAEDYHQKYYLRGSPMFDAFRGYGRDEFVRSRVAARLNAVAGRCADRSLIEAELPTYGLAPELVARVRERAGVRRLP